MRCDMTITLHCWLVLHVLRAKVLVFVVACLVVPCSFSLYYLHQQGTMAMCVVHGMRAS